MLHGAAYHYGQHLLVESNAKEELLSESDNNRFDQLEGIVKAAMFSHGMSLSDT